MPAPNPQILSVIETVDFPEFGLANLEAKIDTGAYTGAIDCTSIEERETDAGSTLVFLPRGSKKIIEKAEYLVKHVRSSNGSSEKRYFVTTNIIVRGHAYEIMISLANRSAMKRPVLIGRRFLQKNHFLVDPNVSNK